MYERDRSTRRHFAERYANKQARIFSWYYGARKASEKKSRWKKQSPMNCGNPLCNFCMNDRYNPWHNNWTKLTIQERKALEDYVHVLQDVDYILEDVDNDGT